jgi:hypothetical protein
LLCHAEQLTSFKGHRRLRKSIGQAKQKLIFYLSFIKANGEWFGPGDRLGVKEFVAMFVNEKIY